MQPLLCSADRVVWSADDHIDLGRRSSNEYENLKHLTRRGDLDRDRPHHMHWILDAARRHDQSNGIPVQHIYQYDTGTNVNWNQGSKSLARII